MIDLQFFIVYTEIGIGKDEKLLGPIKDEFVGIGRRMLGHVREAF